MSLSVKELQDITVAFTDINEENLRMVTQDGGRNGRKQRTGKGFGRSGGEREYRISYSVKIDII